MEPVRIIWHHSADAYQGHQFRKIDEYHKSRGFPISSKGFYVGYHYLVEWDGTVRQARDEDEIGAHDAGENINSIGICMAGNFNIGLPSEAQTAATMKLISEVRDRWLIPITRIEPHRWDDNTGCPGTNLPDNWLINEYLKREVKPLLRFFLWIAEKYNLF